MDGVREVVDVVDVVHQEIGRVVLARTLRFHGADHFVNLDVLEQGNPRIAEAGDVLESRLVFGEESLEGGSHQPSRDLAAAGIHISEICG